MHYDFDIEIDRSQSCAAKIEESYLHFGTNDVIPLWIADMDFRIAQPIIDAIKQRADQGILGYTYRPDIYFESIAAWQEKRIGYRPPLEKMTFSPGVVPAMRIILQVFAKSNANILIQQPVYHPFTDIVNNSGRSLIVNRLQRDQNGYYTVDFDDFEQKAKGDVQYFILCNPHNPVGRVWREEELKRMGEICIKNNVKILSDEIHSDLILHGRHRTMASISPEIAAITTTFIAPSKTFNLAGLQSSTVIFDTDANQKAFVSELKKMDIARNNCFSVAATIAAYTECEEWLDQLLDYIRENIQFIQDYCKSNIPQISPNIPEGTYLSWIDMRGLQMHEDELLQFLVRKAGIALSKGSDFGEGGQGFFRLNAACPRPVLEKTLSQLAEAVRAR